MKQEQEHETPERVIKRYGNRKLYDPSAGSYVTLLDLAGLVAQGTELKVVDQRSGADLTNTVLAQVLLEGLKERTATIPRQVMTRLIRLSYGEPQAWAERGANGPQEIASRARAEAERIAAGLMARGRLTLEEALALRQEISRSLGGLVGEAQRGFEDRVHRLLEKTESEGGVAPSLQALKGRLMALDAFLTSPEPAPRRRRGRSGAKRPARPAKQS